MTTLLSPPESGRRAGVASESDASAVARQDADLIAAMRPSQLRWDNVDWTVAIFIGSMHLGALAAPFFFSWQALVVLVVLHWLTCSIGICLGYHRYLSHRSMKLAKPVEFGVLACGLVAGEGTPLTWAAVHRKHHHHSDQEGDPHSPRDGSWWSHLMWLFVRIPNQHRKHLHERYVPELLDRPVLRFFERTQGLWLTGVGLSLLALGGWWVGELGGWWSGSLGGWWSGALSMLLWGMCVRMVIAYHSTWFVNSATHLWGYQNYDARDDSKNLWWVALFAYGEGWHNNHHAHPSIAPAGHRWWEVDMTWCAIRVLRALGLAWDVKDQIPEKGSAPQGE